MQRVKSISLHGNEYARIKGETVGNEVFYEVRAEAI
jgi:hypothetical protein